MIQKSVDVNGQLGLEPSSNTEIILYTTNQNVGSSLPTFPKSPQDKFDSRPSTNTKTDVKMNRASDLLMAVSVSENTNKAKIIDLAFSAMEELTKLALVGEPLWNYKGGECETLNGFEYMKEFGSVDATLKEIMRMVEVGDPNSLDFNNGESLPFGVDQSRPRRNEEPKEEEKDIRSEASRYVGLVRMNAISIVELLMDVSQWSSTFSNIVSKATLLEILLSAGEAKTYDGTLQVMTMELHLPTALVPTRESYFARYCRQLGYGTWAVVDVSLENLFPDLIKRFQRKPSGCLIQDLPSGCSKVIWVEHVTADNKLVHNIYQPMVVSGAAYGAKRWVAALFRHCQWLETLGAETTPTHDGVLVPQVGRRGLLKLAERMTRSFWRDISASNGNKWMSFPTSEYKNIRVRVSDMSLLPQGTPTTKITFTTSLWLPVPPKRIFDYLRNENSRNEWDIRLCGQFIRELAYIVNGDNPENCISILQVNAIPEKIEILYLQESFTDETGSYMTYAPIDLSTMSRLLNGGNPDSVNILPCGFAILPDRSPVSMQGVDVCGSLLTIAFQVIETAGMKESIPPECWNTFYNIISETASLIKNAVTSDNLQCNFGL